MMYLKSGVVFLLIISFLTGSCQETSFNPDSMDMKDNRMNTPELTWKDVLHYAKHGSPTPDRRVEKTESEWKAQLTADEFRITRQKGTESAFTGAYCEAHDPGIYACKCCGTELFDSREKFESGTGWPSFTQPIKNNVVKYDKDSSFGMVRVEILCNVCDAHLGHVFSDGPGPGGLRFCTNSASIQRVGEQ